MVNEPLNVGGLYVVTVDGMAFRRVVYAPPGHRVIPAEGEAYVLEEGALLCGLETYQMLTESEAYREWVDENVVSCVRTARTRLQVAEARRARRGEKRLRDARRSEEGCLKKTRRTNSSNRF